MIYILGDPNLSTGVRGAYSATLFRGPALPTGVVGGRYSV